MSVFKIQRALKQETSYSSNNKWVARAGHKRMDTTLIYTHLLNVNDAEWAVKTATDIKEATQLLEAGFEYIQDIDGTKLYRKRK